MTPSELVQHPEVEGAIDRLANRIRSNGGISIPREAIADLLATILTVLRESAGPVLDFERAVRFASDTPPQGEWSETLYRADLNEQAATRVAALRARVEELTKALNFYAEKKNYADLCPGVWYSTEDGDEFQEDEGRVARLALKEAP